MFEFRENKTIPKKLSLFEILIAVIAVQASSIHVFGGHLSVVGTCIFWSASLDVLVKGSQSTH